MKRILKNFPRAVAFVLLAFTLQACDTTDDDDAATSGTAKLQVIHASPNAPAVVLNANSAELDNFFDYAEATARLDVDAGIINVDVQGIVPDGTLPSVIGPVDLNLEVDTIYTVLAINPVSTIEALIITRDDTEIAAGELRVQIIHAAPEVGMVDVYVTAPNADITQAAPLGTFAFGSALPVVDVPAGDYQIRVTPTGDNTTVAFDSGTLALAAGSNLTVVAIENTQTGDSPVNLLVASANGGAIVRDTGAPATIRVTHASPDAPAVDILVNDEIQLANGLAFTQSTNTTSVLGATYNVKVLAAGTTTNPVIEADLTLNSGSQYTVIAANLLDSITPIVLNEDRRSVATSAKLQVVHASPAAGNVDIYLSEQGRGIENLEPTIANFALLATTDGFVGLAPGDYDLTITATGSKDPAIGPVTITLASGGIYTAIARDTQRNSPNDTGLQPQLILLDDFIVL